MFEWIILIVLILVLIIWFFIRRKEICEKIINKNFMSEVWISVVAIGILVSIIIYFITILLLNPFFSPQVNVDYSCQYQSYHGEFVVVIQNTGKVGEKNFNLILNNLILKNFTMNPYGGMGGSIVFINKENLSAYSIDQKWAKENCNVILSHNVLDKYNKSITTSGELIRLECSYIPPNSEFEFHFYSIGDNRNIDYEFWGENTKYTLGVKSCKKAICYGRVKDFLLDILTKLKGDYGYGECKYGSYTRGFG